MVFFHTLPHFPTIWVPGDAGRGSLAVELFMDHFLEEPWRLGSSQPRRMLSTKIIATFTKSRNFYHHALPTGMIYHQNHRPQLEDVALLLLHASGTGTAAVGTTTFPRGRQANAAQRRKVRCAVCKQMCVLRPSMPSTHENYHELPTKMVKVQK